MFMSAASPGVVSLFFRNDHYKDHETYLYAIAEVMRHEYESVAKAGIVLQIDCPDLAMGRHIQYADLPLPEFRKRAQMHVEALNHALANIPAEQLRMHVCWGNYEGPHHCDVDFSAIIDIVFKAKPHAISFEAANPRHAHEWTLFESVKLPEGKVLIPGVLESKTNFIEHPESTAAMALGWGKPRWTPMWCGPSWPPWPRVRASPASSFGNHEAPFPSQCRTSAWPIATNSNWPA
jgi:5-methyltetrahydropteroyltriglutamate--homocysteine methyltransferase